MGRLCVSGLSKIAIRSARRTKPGQTGLELRWIPLLTAWFDGIDGERFGRFCRVRVWCESPGFNKVCKTMEASHYKNLPVTRPGDGLQDFRWPGQGRVTGKAWCFWGRVSWQSPVLAYPSHQTRTLPEQSQTFANRIMKQAQQRHFYRKFLL